MKVEPYLNFNGRCDEAIEFYKKAIGAKVNMLMRFKDAPPGQPTDPKVADKVMHANLRVGDGDVMCSDGRCSGSTRFEGVMLSLKVDSDEDAKRIYGALAEGGKITMPMAKTFFASSFGMVEDRFGVAWMVLTGH
jgi:PhnB protein